MRSNYATALVLLPSNGEDKILSGILERAPSSRKAFQWNALKLWRYRKECLNNDFLERLEKQGFVEWHNTKHTSKNDITLVYEVLACIT